MIVNWIVCVVLLLLSTWLTERSILSNFAYNQSVEVIYALIIRPSWSIAIAWIVYACTQGYGGAVISCIACRSLNISMKFQNSKYDLKIVSNLIVQCFLLLLLQEWLRGFCRCQYSYLWVDWLTAYFWFTSEFKWASSRWPTPLIPPSGYKTWVSMSMSVTYRTLQTLEIKHVFAGSWDNGWSTTLDCCGVFVELILRVTKHCFEKYSAKSWAKIKTGDCNGSKKPNCGSSKQNQIADYVRERKQTSHSHKGAFSWCRSSLIFSDK